MNLNELLLTFFVALVVFGPKKLPMLAYHLGKLAGRIYQFKQQATAFWQTQVDEQQLQENRKKAEKVDGYYDPKL